MIIFLNNNNSLRIKSNNIYYLIIKNLLREKEKAKRITNDLLINFRENNKRLISYI